MNLDSFEREREPVWDRLESELGRARGKPERLGVEGSLALGRDYRATVADLALARRRFAGDPVVERLERLVLAGRQAVYARRREGVTSAWRFFSREYWRLIAQTPWLLGASVAALIGSCVVAAVWAIHDPAGAVGLVPGRFQGAAHVHVRHVTLSTATEAGLASSIFTNNIEVTLLSFAGGLTLGVGTFALLAYNGVLIGVLAGLTINAGNFGIFLRYVLPHGMLELTCISVVGAAGLRLAWAVVGAGPLPRGVSLRRQARPAVAVALATAPWLVVAGLTEGFVTPHALPIGAALALGLALGGTFWTLLALRGFRGRRDGQGRAGQSPAVHGEAGHSRARSFVVR
jgi:uncharacterized membrane protein SpoIIM required for sporulation